LECSQAQEDKRDFPATLLAGRGHRRHRLGPHPSQELAEGGQQVRIGGDGQARHAEREVAVEHCVLELRPLALQAL
jgi:hypothetical protein